MRRRARALFRAKSVRWILMGAAQVCTFGIAGLAAFLLRFDGRIPHNYTSHLYMAIPVWITVKSLAFHFANLIDGLPLRLGIRRIPSALCESGRIDCRLSHNSGSGPVRIPALHLSDRSDCIDCGDGGASCCGSTRLRVCAE